MNTQNYLGGALVAAVQMVSTDEVAANLGQAGRLIAQAVAEGAKLVVLPENFAFMGRHERDKLTIAEMPGAGPIQDFLAQTAARHGIWLVGGSLPLKGADPQRPRSACLVYDGRGEPVGRYDKLHLFDVQVNARDTYRESATLEPGEAPVLLETPLGRLGLAICYDLRFPELFRLLAGQGMEILALPSAFTATTGAAHWNVLVRARAIENQCYVIAAGQGGRHANGRDTHGESMIVSPWGEVLASCATGEGIAVAAFDRAYLQDVRTRLPALQHRRL
jgi:predicted amidohydrolase